MPGENTEHQSMLDSIENPVIALNQELKVSYCNPAYARQAGLNVDEIMGRYLLEVFPQKTGDDCHQAYLEVLETGKSSTVVGIIGNKYFNERIFRTPFGILSKAENKDHHKRWEVTVDSMVLNQRAVYYELNDAVIVHDEHDNQIIDVNQAACDIFGYAREEFLCLKMGELTADEPPYNKDDFLLWLKKPAEL